MPADELYGPNTESVRDFLGLLRQLSLEDIEIMDQSKEESRERSREVAWAAAWDHGLLRRAQQAELARQDARKIVRNVTASLVLCPDLWKNAAETAADAALAIVVFDELPKEDLWVLLNPVDRLEMSVELVPREWR